MKTDNNLTLTKDYHSMTLRTGEALPLKEPVKVEISGVLNSPLKWLEKRIITEEVNFTPLFEDSEPENNSIKTSFNTKCIRSEVKGIVPIEHCYILVDREEMSIKMVIGENYEYQTVVTGSLEFHPIFKKFMINEGLYITPFDMADLIKMNRTYFENKDVAMNLVHTLKNFKAKVDKQIEAADDNRGNKRMLLDQVVESNLPASFNMELPIFKGEPKMTVEVEVYIRSSDLTCTLISPEANDIIEDLRDTAISTVIRDIEAISNEIVIIEV